MVFVSSNPHFVMELKTGFRRAVGVAAVAEVAAVERFGDTASIVSFISVEVSCYLVLLQTFPSRGWLEE